MLEWQICVVVTGNSLFQQLIVCTWVYLFLRTDYKMVGGGVKIEECLY